MSESFTAVEYAVLSHLRAAGHGTVPAIAADLLLRLGETEEALGNLVSKGLTRRDGDVYSPSPLAMEMPLAPVQKAVTGRLGPMGRPAAPAPAAPATQPMADVANVFRQARERARLERSGGGA